MTRTVFFVSDQTGITVQTLGEALLAHFPADAIERIDIPFIDSERKAQQVASRIRDTATLGEPPVVLSSITDDHLRAVIRSSGVLCLDVLETFIAPLEQALPCDTEMPAMSKRMTCAVALMLGMAMARM